MVLPIPLNVPLSWKAADADQLRMLQSLQGNILKAHGRPFATLLFFRFEGDQALSARRLLRDLANHHVTNAHQQLLGTERFKACDVSAGPFVHLALSHAGYAALGVEAAKTPADPRFVGGMKHADSLIELGDRAIDEWEQPFHTDLHGMLLVAHDSAARCGALTAALSERLAEGGACVVHVQHGAVLRNAEGEGIEHFGYIDGRSQPLLLAEDIAAENVQGGSSRWNAGSRLDAALVPDPGRTGCDDAPVSFGSYLVFRKLEQDVRGFKRREQELANALHLKGAEARELAGALLVGRFEDGTPVTLSKEARGGPPPNDFNYAGDAGTRCPFHAHIRKTNPRTEPTRTMQMPRRGIPYEDVKRAVHPEELPEADDLAAFDRDVRDLLPTEGVGLLFMAYNAEIGRQFAAMQAGANNTSIPAAPPGPHGIDPVIGQGKPVPGDQKLRHDWDDPASPLVSFDFAGFVTMKGGEYFFSPSLNFLREL